ncbi:ASN_HP2_G0050200.mRNA.1.CDS.1 [Saccharomyces cerevisiae]|nr:BMC_2a_G0052350.mRNA.1.CDS.1 [Saccharomyces cerevisiae]CAI4744627.1 BMB_G0052310.mRNA.1.CDS.1 [Saccharomyces cerevisiae]CAI4824881.1 CDA_G0052230.mRNA.1.CDS.1 [Saccharomyces cerevisiae]CAI4828985.1 CCT_1a_G0052910.mRNA.1.CDS.1 [Saccharomyces cerevisiae]CAI5081103.1 ATV_HP_G0032720.mRNA.1.CDS.1 [Saccharomyces cerevisiae]
MEHTAHIFPIIIKGSPPVMSSNPRRQYRLNLRSIKCLKKPRVRVWQAPWPLEPALSAAKMPRAAHAHAPHAFEIQASVPAGLQGSGYFAPSVRSDLRLPRSFLFLNKK